MINGKQSKNPMYGENRKYPKRNRITIPDVVEKFPCGVTLTHVKLTDTKYGENVICHIKDDDTVYFFGGKLMTSDIHELADGYRNGVDGLNKHMERVGGFHLDFIEEEGKNGNTYYIPDITTD